jgi:hypothetical protein
MAAGRSFFHVTLSDSRSLLSIREIATSFVGEVKPIAAVRMQIAAGIIESGKHNLIMATSAKLCRVLGVTVRLVPGYPSL